ncbi:imelysin family protein [Polaromonas sp. P1(28)-13]|nr:imelysin family protein [Polaromonas sp. P1(28)-13]
MSEFFSVVRSRLATSVSVVVGALVLLATGHTSAQPVPANVAVPFYTPPAFMQGVHRHWYAPRSAEFAAQAGALAPAMAQLCSANAATAADALQRTRAQWQASVTAWDRLAAVAIGPLLQRRSQRQIDFAPTRPELIERAIRSAPADALAMEHIGTPAKGFPGLEWLLWTRPLALDLPHSPACRYAQQLALEISEEAKALAQAFGELAARDWQADEEAATPVMGEMVNQWVGGLERLRWAQMEKPLHSARQAGQGGHNAPVFPRSASGSTAQSWAAHWEGLRSLAVALTQQAPEPGKGLVALETYLRGRGLNPLAGRLAATVQQVQQALPAATPPATPAGSAGLLTATKSLGKLKRLAGAEVAPALEVNIGFSDADGD